MVNKRANPPKKSKSRSSTHAQPKPKVTERKVRTKTQKEAQASRDSAILAKMNGNEGEDDFRGALMAVTAVEKPLVQKKVLVELSKGGETLASVLDELLSV